MLFPSFYFGGFECSTHRRVDGLRLDLVSSTSHDRYCLADYTRLRDAGLLAARDGIRWHLCEPTPGYYDFGSFVPMLRAAREADVLVIWDLLHFGWPDHVDVWEADFAQRFGQFATRFAEVVREEYDQPLFVAPVNEPSFLSYAGGQQGFFNPFGLNRGDELKAQLVRAVVAAVDAVRAVVPSARFVHTDPIINIAANPTRPQDRMDAEAYRQSQFAAWDMISGRLRPELGGRADVLDIVGVNYYFQNQWFHNPFGRESELLTPGHPHHLNLRFMLREVWERYRRPLFVSETGIEDAERPQWLEYIGREVGEAIKLGVPCEGVCWYPIVNHPGWDDDRHCHNGLWDYADQTGHREADAPLYVELMRQRDAIATLVPGKENPIQLSTN
jgi:beta-glucosidase/6-phospho-beta-glucosidase/beta-galactosidase